MIKMIVFDLGNVFLKELENTYDDVGAKLSTLSIEAQYDIAFKNQLKDLAKELNTDYTYLRDRFRKYLNDRFIPAISVQEMQNLKVKYKLGIGSNFISDIYDTIEDYHPYFDLVCISGAMEVEKPDKKFFNILLNEAMYLEVLPKEILFIDDKRENLQAARECGIINTMMYNNKEEDISLYSAINNYIEKLEERTNSTMEYTSKVGEYLNNTTERDMKVLSGKLHRQREALHTILNEDSADLQNELACVGAIPVLNSYGFKPTVPTGPPAYLKELEKDMEDTDTVFNEEVLNTVMNLNEAYDKNELNPIYILLSYGETNIGKVIKFVTKEPYSHASISFDEKLKSLYSFTGKGFVHESITDKNTYGANEKYKYSLYVLFVNNKQLLNMKKVLKTFTKNPEKYAYSYKGIINKFFNRTTDDENKFFCSQFVAELIKSGDETKIKKDPSSYTPYDLTKIKDCFFVKKGYLANYKPKEIERKVDIIKTSIMSAIPLVNESHFREYLKLTDNSDIIIRYKGLDYNEEYAKSHKLLKIYKKTGDIESMKQELAKLWSYYLVIEETYIQKAKKDPSLKSDPKYKDALKAKAFILGDIKEYLTYINEQESFDFAEYYTNSKYNKDAVLITKKQMKQIISLIKDLLY